MKNKAVDKARSAQRFFIATARFLRTRVRGGTAALPPARRDSLVAAPGAPAAGAMGAMSDGGDNGDKGRRGDKSERHPRPGPLPAP